MKFDTKSEYMETEITLKGNVHKVKCNKKLFDEMNKLIHFQNADFIDVIKYEWAIHIEQEQIDKGRSLLPMECFDEEWSNLLLIQLNSISHMIRHL